VANDNHFQLMAVSYAIKFAKLNILLEAVNGLEVLQYIQTNSDVKLDVVLLDLDMPIMDGFEACKQIVDFYRTLSTFKHENKN
jgi:CheY-like chemotaxis protein